MGRPLNKKLFGNRNIGTTGTGDNNIGGQGLAAFTLPGQLGSLIINSTYAQPQLVIPAPTLPGGVQATATVVWEVESITVSNGLVGNGYGTTTGGATTLTGLAGVTANITAVGSGQGEVQVIVPVNRGEFTTVPTVEGTYQIVGGDGEQQAAVKFRVKSITTVEKGSGYAAAPTLSWTTAGTDTGGTAVGAPTVALTTDTGTVGGTTNQENAILVSAQTTSGGSDKAGDIVSQKGARNFKVKTADGTAICKLTASANLAVGQMSIIATDARGNTYYVTKLTAKKATLVRKTQNGANAWVHVEGGVAQWSFAAAAGSVVQVANA